MTLQEALKSLQESNGVLWMRPVCWKGIGEAIRLSGDGLTTELVPTVRGGVTYMTRAVKNLLGEWEVVTPDQVLTERE